MTMLFILPSSLYVNVKLLQTFFLSFKMWNCRFFCNGSQTFHLIHRFSIILSHIRVCRCVQLELFVIFECSDKICLLHRVAAGYIGDISNITTTSCQQILINFEIKKMKVIGNVNRLHNVHMHIEFNDKLNILLTHS